jgi:hypothetical protein
VFKFKEWPAEPYRVSPADAERLLALNLPRSGDWAMADKHEPELYECYDLDGAGLIVYRQHGRLGVIFPLGRAWGVVADPNWYDLHPLEFGLADPLFG